MSEWSKDLRQARPGWLLEETWTLVCVVNGEDVVERKPRTGTVLLVIEDGLLVDFDNGQRFVGYDAEDVRVRPADHAQTLRVSSMLRKLRSGGKQALARKLESQLALEGFCAVHGRLDDPILYMHLGRTEFACPWCSGPGVFAAWEAEGRLN